MNQTSISSKRHDEDAMFPANTMFMQNSFLMLLLIFYTAIFLLLARISWRQGGGDQSLPSAWMQDKSYLLDYLSFSRISDKPMKVSHLPLDDAESLLDHLGGRSFPLKQTDMH